MGRIEAAFSRRRNVTAQKEYKTMYELNIFLRLNMRQTRRCF